MRLFAICAAVLFSAAALAAEDPAKGKKAVDLFDGKTLNGWKVITCEAEVKDGAIFLKSGDGIVRTEREYGDFVLECEWKALKAEAYDSGVFFRCTDPPADRAWPKVYQANCRQKQEGNVDVLKKARSKGLVKAGEWNKFKLTVIGTTASLEINGKKAWTADGVEAPKGYIALQAEVPNGGQFLFRNIKLVELDAK